MHVPAVLGLIRRCGGAFGGAFGALTDVVLPQTCYGCGVWIPAARGVLCADCAAAMKTLTEAPYCPRCGRSMPPSAIHERDCARCRTERFWNVGEVVRIGPYEPPLRGLITGLKYARQQRNAWMAAELLAAALRGGADLPRFDWLVPVPMPRLRRWQRPCDHALLLAQELSRRLKTPVLPALRRIRHTPSQTRLPSRQRRFENVRGCFALKPRQARHLAGAAVCIVDNLIVSGATVHEMSMVLRRAGAKPVVAAVLARSALRREDQAAVAAVEVGDRAAQL